MRVSLAGAGMVAVAVADGDLVDFDPAISRDDGVWRRRAFWSGLFQLWVVVPAGWEARWAAGSCLFSRPSTSRAHWQR